MCSGLKCLSSNVISALLSLTLRWRPFNRNAHSHSATESHHDYHIVCNIVLGVRRCHWARQTPVFHPDKWIFFRHAEVRKKDAQQRRGVRFATAVTDGVSAKLAPAAANILICPLRTFAKWEIG